MRIRHFGFLAVLLCLVSLTLGTHAQPRGLAADQGYVGLGMALRQLSTVGIFMQAVAHPDDENNGLLVMLKRGQGIRTVLATATRGDGGQNEIGPELGDALGVLRTAELMSMHRYDGAEQYFTRAVDFGYSFSLEETFQRWGKDEIVGDYVRLIRMTRPDVIMAMSPEGTGGGQHHQASARIVGEAFRAAADPERYPEQLKEGLRPWQPGKLYYYVARDERIAPGPADQPRPRNQDAGFPGGPRAAGPQGPDVLRIDNEVWDPLLGDTYAYLGSEARSMHKCQGMGQLLALPGPSVFTYRLADSAGRAKDRNASLFDGINPTLAGVAQYIRGTPPPPLTSALAAIAEVAADAQRVFAADGPSATIQPLADGLDHVRSLRASLPQMADLDEGARYEIDFRLKTKEEQFEDALVLAAGLQFDVLADDGQVVAGQPIAMRNVTIANRGAEPVELKAIAFEGLEGGPSAQPGTIASGAIYRFGAQGTSGRGGGGRADTALFRVASNVPLTAPYWHRLPNAARYEFDPGVPFGVPFRPTPFRARFEFSIHGSDVTATLPVQYRYEGNVFSGEKRMDLQVVPALSVRVTPDITIVPVSPATKAARQEPAHVQASGGRQSSTPPSPPDKSLPADEREVRVTVANGTRGALDAEVVLQMPDGWRSTPPSTKVSFAREDEVQTIRFRVRPPKGTAPGAYRVKAIATIAATTGTDGQAGTKFDRGYRVIEYQHIEHRQMIEPAEATVKLIDVKVRPHRLVGYVMGVGDQVPPAIEQLGAQVNMLTPDDLAWGNLSRYDAIVTGVRAYERREDLREHNQRLLDYVKNGGTLIVQYNKTEFNRDPSGRPTQYGPYPAQVSGNRVTDENAPVQVLQPQNPIFNAPNKIGPASWKGWVQERGLYFLGEKDPRYVDLVQMEDPFPYNAGVKQGALVEADYGKGHWIYIGLNLWRQLPAGTDGAYQIMANLLSLRPETGAKRQAEGGRR